MEPESAVPEMPFLSGFWLPCMLDKESTECPSILTGHLTGCIHVHICNNPLPHHERFLSKNITISSQKALSLCEQFQWNILKHRFIFLTIGTTKIFGKKIQPFHLKNETLKLSNFVPCSRSQQQFSKELCPGLPAPCPVRSPVTPDPGFTHESPSESSANHF